MALETEKFIISGIEHKYATSREIRGDRMQSPPQRVGIDALNAACKQCGRTTRVTSYGLGLTPFIGGVIVTCPFCGNEESFTGKRLEAAA